MNDYEPPPSAQGQPGPGDRRSVTVSLPSTAGLARLITVALVLLLAAALVVEAVRLHDTSRDKARLTEQLRAGPGLTELQQSALSTATTYAEQFATYNYRSLDTDFQLTESHAIEPFLSSYRSETAKIRADIVKVKASSTGKVISAGVASIAPTVAVVDLFLNQTIANRGSSQPRVETQRVEMTLVRRNNEWLISKVELP